MNVVFHHPLPLNTEAKSASGIRPLRMLSAFEDLGCEVDVITGYSWERSALIRRMKDKARNGKRYEFVYSESSTMPTVLTDPHHLPVRPLMDGGFFSFCRNNRIPVGLFYRDIYWLFDAYGKGLNRIQVMAAKAAYRFDLWVYARTLDRLYVPSREMGDYIRGVDPEIIAALPPGHISPSTHSSATAPAKGGPLRLFYVGGMSDHYRLHILFQVVSSMPQIDLTVCTRDIEWKSVKEDYPSLTPNIRIIHETGEGMTVHLQECDIAVLFVEPHEYWKFASPFKLYEYLGYHKPIVASRGTLSGTFVSENHVGWTLPYDSDHLRRLLVRLLDNPVEISQCGATAAAVADQHSWKARAQQVINDLSQ